MFLGYGAERKGYRLYDPKRAKVFHSRDVVFNEKKRGIEREPRCVEEEKRCVQIEYSTNENPVDEDLGESSQPTSAEPQEPIVRRSTRERQ